MADASIGMEMNTYTIGSGMSGENLLEKDYAVMNLDTHQRIELGWISRRDHELVISASVSRLCWQKNSTPCSWISEWVIFGRKKGQGAHSTLCCAAPCPFSPAIYRRIT
mgnify:CR=1 FL=1